MHFLQRTIKLKKLDEHLNPSGAWEILFLQKKRKKKQFINKKCTSWATPGLWILKFIDINVLSLISNANAHDRDFLLVFDIINLSVRTTDEWTKNRSQLHAVTTLHFIRFHNRSHRLLLTMSIIVFFYHFYCFFFYICFFPAFFLFSAIHIPSSFSYTYCIVHENDLHGGTHHIKRVDRTISSNNE